MITKSDVDRLRDEYRERFEDGKEKEPYKTLYKDLVMIIHRHFSRTGWEYYTAPEQEMPEEIEQAYSTLKKVLEFKVITNPKPNRT